ncbi:RagB/SusD family nutrient uptake outer membrane protein [Parabacteroides sp. W1-Q-101]|nr:MULTISPECIES: RagB/SusD family nutrient uptake outer membrane protein [Parabacteroides]MCM0715856.1 RagB/SusD family nutrient uptake outer membrane protein [Parabacteroides sp. TA-V-105]MCM0721716.1 RagB/SusD family nutrient uptake outer membrane protein [Parabacteroides sp. W1-Q-101]
MIKIAAIGFVSMVGLSGCNDSFMDKYSETSITEDGFFKTPGDLEIYTNNMYGYISADYWDVASDNVMYVEEAGIYSKMRGELNPNKAGAWSWGSIRNVNFMLARTNNVVGDVAEINHYIGLARMFRAKLYYDKVLSYSDVPWYSRDLQTTDTEELFKPQDPRALVVDSVMADLDFAVKNMKDNSSGRTRWYRSGALAMQARIALAEGCWRKYHPELGLNDADRFFKVAADACNAIMNTGNYELSVGEGAYGALFNSQDLSSNKEMIIFEDYSNELGRLHGAGARFDWTTGLSRDLMEDYYVIEDGKAKRFQDVPDYDKKTFLEIFENRDPRLGQTFMTPGFIRPGSSEPHRQKITIGGYPQVKFSPGTFDQLEWGKAYTDLPLIRYAEVLLMYAEAKAELGELTQDDIDRSINLIRDRAGVPRATLSEWLANIDPVQANRYPNVTSSQKGAILEVRRERRIELACEGFRFDDLMRWGAGKLMEKAPEGMYIGKLGYIDLTGDGQPDYAVVATQADADAIPQADKEKYKLNVEILEGNTIELTGGDKGYIRLIAQVNKWKFIEPKYYYSPIATQDIVLNKNLVQNKYWVE